MVNHSKKIIIGLCIILVICFGVMAELYRQTKTVKSVPQPILDEVAVLTEQINKLMILPTNEKPTVATVSDPEKLNDQPFFARALAGDKVLIYQTSQKAILYRPSAGKIIEVSPINLNPPPQPVQQASVATSTLKKTTNNVKKKG